MKSVFKGTTVVVTQDESLGIIKIDEDVYELWMKSRIFHVSEKEVQVTYNQIETFGTLSEAIDAFTQFYKTEGKANHLIALQKG